MVPIQLSALDQMKGCRHHLNRQVLVPTELPICPVFRFSLNRVCLLLFYYLPSFLDLFADQVPRYPCQVAYPMFSIVGQTPA